MIPAGYMAKRVAERPDWLAAERVTRVYSVSRCVSEDFTNYIPFWKHNGYWLFDSPEIIIEVASEHDIDLADAVLFYYEVYDQQFDFRGWARFDPEASFGTHVRVPDAKVLEGYDVVTFSVQTSPECSPLSCNSLAVEIETNAHCLLQSFDEARTLVESGRFDDSEPGPYRIFAVYSVAWPVGSEA
jgi:hypothetical protein